MMQHAIYKILCTVNGRYYIGQTRRFGMRKHHHLADLHGGKHPNRKLQADFDSFGESAFAFSLLKEVPSELAVVEESQAIWHARSLSHDLYNGTHHSASSKIVEPNPAHQVSSTSKYYEKQNDAMSAEAESVLTFQEIARHLKVGKASLTRMINNGQFPVAHVVLPNGEIRYFYNSFRSWIDSRTYVPILDLAP